ncbi:hypothetical protein B0I37DRAFT_381145 [Chaetomium sp. MPI-CAGE-AT-0009]|nr:hypothetical protein B0I37DRAFT_381145 [Chaetomium sp. MPI-CAGE-AT-0009]
MIMWPVRRRLGWWNGVKAVTYLGLVVGVRQSHTLDRWPLDWGALLDIGHPGTVWMVSLALRNLMSNDMSSYWV